MNMNKMIPVLALCATLATGAADAHAMLDRAEPRVGSTVNAAPREVTLWFTEQLEPAFSGVEVRNASGARVDSGKAQVDGTNRSVLRVRVNALPPGTYKVNWHALSVDTHRTQGSFTFKVAP